MYETIYVEKNKSSRFGIHFYLNASQWKVFLEHSGVDINKASVICNAELKNEAWKTLADEMPKEEVFGVSNDNRSELRRFLDEKKNTNTFIIFNEPLVMDALQVVITAADAKLSFICIPVTPFAQFAGISILPKCEENGEVICKELLPKAVYVDVSVLKEASPVSFQGGIAAAFRLAISYKASLFEWMISNMYELMDAEDEALYELLERGYTVYKERIEKDTAKERSLPVFAGNFYKLLSAMASPDVSEADLWALSMLCQAYLSWKKDLLSMEEYYEIRDMFVFFGLGITETFVTDVEMFDMLKKQDNALLNAKNIYIRKIGKLLMEEAASEELIKDALLQIYFNEMENE